MMRSERTIISRSDPRWETLVRHCRLANNLYNATLYDGRQHHFEHGSYKSSEAQCRDFVSTTNPDYYALPTKVSKQIMRQAHKGFISFFSLLRKKRAGSYNKAVRIPGYKESGGMSQLLVSKESIGQRPAQNNNGTYTYVISVKDMGLEFVSRILPGEIKQVRFTPRGDHFVQEVVYDIPAPKSVPKNNRHMSVDLGVNNLAAVYSNVAESLLYNGKPVKSINQFFNKVKSKIAQEGGVDTRRFHTLSRKRNFRIHDYFHKVSSHMINYAVSNNIDTIVVGYNVGWKQGVRIGRKNNQKFASIPFHKLLSMITYKAENAGIEVVTTEESYTSKTSFLDAETPVKHESYAGRRTKRGLFRASDNRIINADINGAGQIMRKVFPDAYVYTAEGIAGCRSPRKVTLR